MADDPSATYRGYRKQALYVLWRMLTDEERDTRAYRPEGEEDLAVFDSGERLVEAVQVKDRAAASLALSHFKPHSPDGFFARMKRRREEHPNCRHLLASFGPLGAELDRAIADSGADRNAVAVKLHEKNPAISETEAAQLLASLKGNVIRPDELQLHVDVLAALAGTIAGVHGESAIKLLLYWVFEASERHRTLTRTSLLQQLQRIGDYLATLRDHTTQWMVAVQPLTDAALTSEELESLRQEYRRGVQARWNHILAEADCPRPHRLAELHEKVSRHAAVVVRGASGQGKSSLALRYLHDYCPEGLRFYVRFVDGREHALRVANALRGHVEQLRIRTVVLLDLSPSDSGWVEFVREMTDAGLKVLVTVREEDFRRAGTFTPNLDLAELVLDSVTREEAERIYAALTAGKPTYDTLDFDEAWARFTAVDAGPLLEFTHLVSQGQTLVAKIGGQVARLQTEAGAGGAASGFTRAHLQLLALAAVANAAECRVKLEALCAAVGIDPLTHPLAVLENEYLLRLRSVGTEVTVGGLHALRSQAIEAALLRDCPEAWGELAVRCLPLVVDEDVERFLLSGFSRRPEHSVALEAALRSLPLRTWSHAGGVARALLWEGVNRYERENHETLSAAVAKHDTAWWVLCDAYVGLDAAAGEELRKSVAEIAKGELPKITLTPKSRVFTPLREWAVCAQPPAALPATPTDWVMAGDLAFWLGQRGITGPLRKPLEALLPDPLPEQLSLTELAQFISGRHALGDAAFAEWHARHAAHLSRRFVCETNSIHLADDEDEVKVFFPVILADPVSGMERDAHDWHAQAMKRVQLLRQLYPHRAKFSSQGLGMEALGEVLPHDPTTKSIPVENLRPERAIRLNAVFANLVSYRLQRAASWRAYAEVVFALRRSVCDCFRKLHRAWGRFLEESKVQSKTIRQMPSAELDRLKALSHLPMFPRIAVDEWGFVSEDRDNTPNTDGSHAELRGSLRRFERWRTIWRDYESGVRQVADRVLEETKRHLALKNLEPSEPMDPTAGRLLIMNLGDAWAALAEMQTEFRRWFARYLSSQHLEELEHHEHSTLRHLWAVAFHFVYGPLERVSGGAAFLERAMERQRRKFLCHLKDEVIAVMAGNGTVRVSEGPHSIDGRRCIVVACDHRAIATIETLRPQVVLAIWRAAHGPAWRYLEWTPITVEWPNIFVTHLLRGRGLVAGGTYLATSVLFGTESDFKVMSHHVIELPVSGSDFTAAGIVLWDIPLLTAALNLQSRLAAFTLTMLRFYPLIQVALQHRLSDETLEPGLKAFSHEISTLRRTALGAYEDLFNLLRTQSDAQAPVATDWGGRLERLCNNRLLSVEPDATLTITLDAFADWVERLNEGSEEANALLGAILEFAVPEEAA